MNKPRHINAEHVLLALVIRRANPRCRWAAMADHECTTFSCGSRYRGKPFHCKPLLSPMQRGDLHHAIERQRLTQGLPSIRATFGTGLKALLAEPSRIVPAEVRP